MQFALAAGPQGRGRERGFNKGKFAEERKIRTKRKRGRGGEILGGQRALDQGKGNTKLMEKYARWGTMG